MRRLHSAVSGDPFVWKFAENKHFLHYIGSQVVREAFLSSQPSDIKAVAYDPITVRLLACLVDINIRKCKRSNEARAAILEGLPVLPSHLAIFLFFNALHCSLCELTADFRARDVIVCAIET